MREARSVRTAREIGYRREVFNLLQQALAVGTTNVDHRLVRREAAACLGDWMGLDSVDVSDPKGNFGCALTTDGTLAAIATGEDNVSLRETRMGREVALLELAGTPCSFIFDRSGRALLAALAEPKRVIGERPKSMRVEKWSLRADGSWKRDWAQPAAGFTRFLQNSGTLAYVDTNREVTVVEPATGRMIRKYPTLEPVTTPSGVSPTFG